MNKVKTKTLLLLSITLTGIVIILARASMSKVPTPEQLRKVFPGDSQQVFEESQQFILFSLDPCYDPSGNAKDFHGYKVLGQLQVTNPRLQNRLRKALYRGIAEPESNEMGAACFEPRHGVRVVRGHNTVDLVICFACAHIVTYAGQQRGRAITTDSPQAFFDRTLRDANVPLPNR